jgi:two-component system, sensor histidine kinase
LPGEVFETAARGEGALDIGAAMDVWPECVRMLSTGGEIEYINPAGLALSGLDDFELLRGRPWPSVWPEEIRPQVQAAIEAAARGEVGSFRAARMTANGERQWLDNVVSPMRDAEGKVVRLLAVSRDVTSTMASDRFLETLVQLLPNPILAKDARDGRYILINRAAEEAFGVQAEEWIGKTAFELFPKAEADQFAAEDAEVVASRETRVSEEEAITTRNGVRYFTTKKFATYDAERAVHVVTLGEDVTDRRNAAVALRGALAEAEQANRSKSEFLANMSHEIRTPLNGIVAGADMLTRARLEPRARELVEIIASSAVTLERLLSDILDLARIEAGRVTVETAAFHFGDLVRSTAALSRLQADEKGVALEVEIVREVDSHFAGDPHRIRQVLVNLLSNAVKFTEHGRVTVAAEPLETGVRVTVRDTGIGFKPGMKDAIFGRFQQVDGSITRRFGGTGLGMTISRELVQLMGGVLDAEGRDGEGATFWFDLPLERAEAVDAPAEAPQLAAPDRPLRVLLADDHPTNRKVVELMLDGLAEVVSVENGRDALIAFGSGPFDLILMDMQMPVMDGLAATRRIRDSERQSGRAPTPLIMLTANALPEHVAASLAAGADRHLEKPVTLPGLLDAMNEAMAGAAECDRGASNG